MNTIHNDYGLSDALGAIVLVAVVGMGVGLLGLAVLSTPLPQKIPSLDAEMKIVDHSVILRHQGGDALSRAEVSFISNGTDITGSFNNSDGSPWSGWSVGDTLTYDVPADQPVPDSLQIVFTGGSSSRVLLSLGSSAVAIRVNCGGGPYTDARNNLWSADQAYTPGGWGYTGSNRNAYSTTNPITNTTDPILYQTESWFSGPAGEYRFTVPNGNYLVTLKFAEIYSGINPSNPRIFSVTINGNPVITGLNLYATSGLYSATDGTYPVTVNDGDLLIDFIKGQENPKISAIEIVRE